MRLDSNVFDLWVFCRASPEPRYLLLHTSQEKADRWFGGGRFWQIPSGFAAQDEAPHEFLVRHLVGLDLTPLTIWAVEHVYTIYNRRYNALQVIPVFAAEIAAQVAVSLDWEHSEYRWATASECAELLTFRGLHDGLKWLREYISETSPAPEFRLQ
jgi:dATP pyrophosphohydrolase